MATGETHAGGCRAKTGLTLVESLQDAELVAVMGQSAPADAGLNGKLVYVGDVEQAVREPDAFLARAKAEAETYQAPQAAAPVKADGQNASWRSPLAQPAWRTPLWRPKPLKAKRRNAAGG